MDTLRTARWVASLVLATGLGVAALIPKPAHAQDDRWVRVIVDGRPVYYRVVDRHHHRYVHRRHDRTTYPAYIGDYNPTARRVTCNKSGNCTVTWYDPRYRP